MAYGMTTTVVQLSDLQVSPAGSYVGSSLAAPRWEAGYVDDPAYWGTRFLDPVIAAVGPHCGPSNLNVSGGPGLYLGLDAAITNDGYSDGPLVWLMPCLLVAGREVLRLAPQPLAFSDLYPDHLDGDGTVIASPDSTHSSHGEYLADLAPRVCAELNDYFASRHETALTVPEVDGWARDCAWVRIETGLSLDERGRPAIADTARAAGEAFGLASVGPRSTLYEQLESLAAGVVELAPRMEADFAGHDGSGGPFVDLHGPVDALTPAARSFLAQLSADRRITIGALVDGAEVLRGN
ncbi:hypothetical protein M3G04_04650 [Dietzia cinnamea]|uniref:hypothetical protein n=1 Tax=Dietzia cinnamea TaxID=321318 RepID=UPI00223C454E|nr:hypothetical protein [Dietzia cinnamea]MCT2300193.1 hypothetical protein [Dietzia cinnamea]